MVVRELVIAVAIKGIKLEVCMYKHIEDCSFHSYTFLSTLPYLLSFPFFVLGGLVVLEFSYHPIP